MAEVTTADVVAALGRDQRLRGFVGAGRIESMPARQSRRVLLLGEVAQLFEPGVRYPEQNVNQMLAALFDDYAALRRYLVEEGLLTRAAGEYWRSGGPVST
jgi:hypothetical protein